MASPGDMPGAPGDGPAATGRLFVGTRGFSYPKWAPKFYAPGLRPGDLLAAYGTRLSCCEINNTFYRHPTETSVASWVAATPATFRFAVKAQRGGSMRALLADPTGTVGWLTAPYRFFGPKLGCVLFPVPAGVTRDAARLAAL